MRGRPLLYTSYEADQALVNTTTKKVVLGLVTSKHAQLESKDALKRRIDEAAKIVPLEQLAISPQCGFSSTADGNVISSEGQMEKLMLCTTIAKEVWGGVLN